MPPKRLPIQGAALWLARAHGNLIRASQPVQAGTFYEDLCFDAQQAAEKSLKALLINCKVRFPFTHDIADLFTEVENAGISLPSFAKEAAKLTQYSAATRYPGAYEPVTSEERDEAIEIARLVVEWAEGLLK